MPVTGAQALEGVVGHGRRNLLVVMLLSFALGWRSLSFMADFAFEAHAHIICLLGHTFPVYLTIDNYITKSSLLIRITVQKLCA